MKKFHQGDLIEIVGAPDQAIRTRLLIGKLGLVLEHVPQNSSQNIYLVLVEDLKINLHALDMRLVA